MKAVHLSVLTTAEDVKRDIQVEQSKDLEFSTEVLSKISSLVFDIVTNHWTPDLLAFSKHAGRQNCNNDDVLLLLRRNEALMNALNSPDTIEEVAPNAPKKGKTQIKIDKAVPVLPIATSTPFKPSLGASLLEFPEISAIPLVEKTDTMITLNTDEECEIIEVAPENVNVKQNNVSVDHGTTPLASSTPYKPSQKRPLPGLSCITPISTKSALTAPSGMALGHILEEEEEDETPLQLDATPLQLNATPLQLNAIPHVNQDHDSFSRDVFYEDDYNPENKSAPNSIKDPTVSSFNCISRIEPLQAEHSSPPQNRDPNDSFDLFQETPRKECPKTSSRKVTPSKTFLVQQREQDSFDDEDLFVSPAKKSFSKKTGRTDEHVTSNSSFDIDRTLIQSHRSDKTILESTCTKQKLTEEGPWKNKFSSFTFDSPDEEEAPETVPLTNMQPSYSHKFSFSPDSFDEETPIVMDIPKSSLPTRSSVDIPSGSASQQRKIASTVPISDIMNSFVDDDTEFIGLDSLM